MTSNDLSWSTALHRATLPNGFFVRLGPRFLRHYHRSFIESPHSLAITIEDAGVPIGFAVGTVDDQAHYRRVLRTCGLRMAASVLAGLAVRPSEALRFGRSRARRYVRGAIRLAGRPRGGHPSAGLRPQGTLVHIAVDPRCHGQGCGGRLLAAFEDELIAAGRAVATVQTATAADFYRQNGWVYVRSCVDLDGNPHQVLEKQLTR